MAPDHHFALPDDEELLKHVVDVHCHPTESPIVPEAVRACAVTVCAMASNPNDQELVKSLALEHPDKVIPCFGYHPWYSHWIAVRPFSSKEDHYRQLFIETDYPNAAILSDFYRLLEFLPEPFPLSELLSELRTNLTSFPNAMLGEVGLDRAMKVRYGSGDQPRKLSSFHVPIEHQISVLEAQLDLAVELERPVSLHSVQSQAVTLELLARMQSKYGQSWRNISIDMHSCGLSAETWKLLSAAHGNIFLSLSTVINSRSPAHRKLIAQCSPDRLLVESDYNDISFSTQRTWDMVNIIAGVKEWRVEKSWNEELEEGVAGAVHILEENWRAFKEGKHEDKNFQTRRKRRLRDFFPRPNKDEDEDSA